MAHVIAKMWSSKVKGQDDKVFDLEKLNADGTNVKDCKHDGVNLHSGSVEKINDGVYLIMFNKEPDSDKKRVQYRGVAIMGLDGQFRHIFGVKQKVLLAPVAPEARTATEEKVALSQDEGTWTGNQP